MSFQVPKNVPRFDHSQREFENVYWGSSGRTHQRGSTSNGLGSAMGGFFDNKDLPMYKDKPYAYASSRRQTSFWRRKPLWLGTVVLFMVLYWWLRPLPDRGFIKSSDGGSDATNDNGIGGWGWLKPKDSLGVNWDTRRESVKDAFKLSWDSYEQHAWGKDEYNPIAKTGKQMTPSGMGWIIVDALDTLMIMNLTSRLAHARAWMTTSLKYDQDQEVNTFETTIRMLGGLLSAHYLSTEYPDMAPLSEDDQGKSSEDLYLEKAADLADRLLGAFDTPSGVPYASVNLKTLKGVESHTDGGASSTAEAGSLQLEFKYLALLMGEKIYWEKAEKVIKALDDNGMEDGLLPIFIYAKTGEFRGENIRLGSRGDSYYEYLIKQYLQTSKEEPLYLELWNEALAGIRKHLVTYTKRSHLTVVGERPDGLGNPLLPKMDHLVCFLPGTIALAATDGQTLTAARKTQGWSQKQEEEMDLAKELIKTCWGMYKATRTGLAPEITYFEVDDPPLSEADGKLSSASIDFAEVPSFGDAPWKSDYIIKNQDSHNLQRPETAESLFYMWRITGDVTYREWGWEMFKSFLNYTSVEGGGYTSLSNANVIPPLKKDNMESFWLAETLKYLYLLFSPNTLLPLDNVVINTEAHVFPRFKLTKGFKTGWNRKPRDSAGRIIQAEMHEENREAPALPRIPLRHQNPNPYMGRPQMGPKVVKVVDAKAESDAMEKVEVEARKLSTQDDSEA